jgi:CheY-like chemotaxis protein
MRPGEQERDSPAHARILITEPFREVRRMLERAVGQFGHVPVRHSPDWRKGLPDIDVLLLEPSLEDGVELADALRLENPHLPIICTCATNPSPAIDALGPVTVLVKPFRLSDLERALTEAVSRAIRGT